MTSPYARNLLQIGDGTLRLCSDFRRSGASGRKYTFDEVIEKTNEVVLELITRTGMLKSTGTIPLAENTNVYDLPRDCLRVLRLSLHGRDGWVLLPRSADTVVMTGSIKDGASQPDTFFRDLLDYDQIGVWPIANADGSTFTRDQTTGVLRRITDADGNELTYDAERPLRRISGVPFRTSGRGRVVREVISTWGNLGIIYMRLPQLMAERWDYPDSDIPPWIHKDIKYGVAAELLKNSRNQSLRKKRRFYQDKWNRKVMGRFRGRVSHSGLGSRQSQVM